MSLVVAEETEPKWPTPDPPALRPYARPPVTRRTTPHAPCPPTALSRPPMMEALFGTYAR
jgi:hypothetical protein